jgi:ABC-type nitrate/sulfonate/bicarbonate transport system substrate-binding protein
MRYFQSLIAVVIAILAEASALDAKDRLRVSIASYDGTTELVVAVTEGAGLFERQGLKTELITISGAASSTNALNLGEVDFDVRAPVNAILARLKGLDFAFLAAAQNYLDYSIVTRPGVNQATDLRGKKVGIVRFGGKTDLLVRYLFRRLGLEPIKDFAMLQVGPAAARLSALQSGVIDATVVSPPQAYSAMNSGLKILDVPYAPFFQGAIIVPRAFLRADRGTATRFLKAYIDGIHFFLTRREETLAILSRFYRNTDRGWLDHVYKSHQQHQIGRKPYPNWEATQAMLDIMATDDPGVKKLNPKQLFDLSILEELDRSGWIEGLYRDGK